MSKPKVDFWGAGPFVPIPSELLPRELWISEGCELQPLGGGRFEVRKVNHADRSVTVTFVPEEK